MASTAVQKFTGVKDVVETIIKEVATLKRPVTAAAVAAFILSVTGVIGIDATTLAGILGAVGVADAALEHLLGINDPNNP